MISSFDWRYSSGKPFKLHHNVTVLRLNDMHTGQANCWTVNSFWPLPGSHWVRFNLVWRQSKLFYLFYIECYIIYRYQCYLFSRFNEAEVFYVLCIVRAFTIQIHYGFVMLCRYTPIVSIIAFGGGHHRWRSHFNGEVFNVLLMFLDTRDTPYSRSDGLFLVCLRTFLVLPIMLSIYLHGKVQAGDNFSENMSLAGIEPAISRTAVAVALTFHVDNNNPLNDLNAHDLGLCYLNFPLCSQQILSFIKFYFISTFKKKELYWTLSDKEVWKWKPNLNIIYLFSILFS